MAVPRTEFAFLLPKGLVSSDGVIHREGAMRLATGRDELEALADADVHGADDPRLTIVLLARVITRLGTLTTVTPDDVADLFAADVHHLREIYAAVNYGTQQEIDDLVLADPTDHVAALQVGPGAPTPTPRKALPAERAGPRALRTTDTSAAADPAPAPVDPVAAADDTPPQPARPRPTGRRARIEEVGKSSGNAASTG